MDKDILKSAIFGYSKISVCKYIATMNEEFNEKLIEETDSFCKEHSRQQKKIDDLEAELAVLKQNAYVVGRVVLDAGQYAEQIRQKAQDEAAAIVQQAKDEAGELLHKARADAEQLRAKAKDETDKYLLEIKAKGEAQTEKLKLYTEAIARLREDMAILAGRTDDALNTFAKRFLSSKQDFEDSES